MGVSGESLTGISSLTKLKAYMGCMQAEAETTTLGLPVGHNHKGAV